MNKAKPLTETRTTAHHYFIVAGISLTSIRKVLRPALPKKRQEASYLVAITATTDNNVEVSIAGAAVELPAIVNIGKNSLPIQLPLKPPPALS